MAIPTQNALRNPLLIEIARAGGEVRPANVYDAVASHFPEMTGEDRELELACGHNKFNNQVQWQRQRLVDEGLIDKSKRGVWKLTAEGQRQAEQFLKTGQKSITNAKVKASTTEVLQTTSPSLVELINAHDVEVRKQLLSLLSGMDPFRFEELCGRLLRAMGFRDVIVTQRSRDGGIDGHGRLKLGIVTVSAAFQCKRYQPTQTISRPTVDEFRGATQGKYDQAILMTTANISEGARSESIRPGCIPIVMLDGAAIMDLMIQHGIGVVSKPLSVPQIDEDYFASDDESTNQD